LNLGLRIRLINPRLITIRLLMLLLLLLGHLQSHWSFFIISECFIKLLRLLSFKGQVFYSRLLVDLSFGDLVWRVGGNKAANSSVAVRVDQIRGA
jgi:hypothetical protein